MSPEHDDALAAARAHLARRTLGPLPDSFAETRESLHYVAENLIKRKRELETGNEIALCFTPGGFGTPVWDVGADSGASGQARVEGDRLVLVEDGEERRCPAGDLVAGAALLGVGSPDRETVEVDPNACAALADWYAFGTVVLADLIERHADLDPAPIRLWPEHFDVATELGSETRGTRANYGASPGDHDHPEPYIYVGPWDQEVGGEIWNATAFVGAELTYEELAGAEDQLGTALAFLSERQAALG